MRWLPITPALGLFALLSSCTDTPAGGGTSGSTGVGPFDAAGNYHEEWADNPSKWKSGGHSGGGDSEVAKIQSDVIGGGGGATPYSGTPYSKPVTPVATVPIVRPPATTAPKVIASTQPKPRHHDEDDDDEEDAPRSTSKGKGGKTLAKNDPKAKGKGATASTTSKGKDKDKTASTTKGKNGKTVTPTAKTKGKPAASNHYAVRQGDSLYAIAKRYGTTASAIQKANHMSSAKIHPGQSLVVPKD